MIYLDYQATTPLAPEAREAMLPWLGDKFGNPHSPHRMGREAAAAVEMARSQVMSALLPPLVSDQPHVEVMEELQASYPGHLDHLEDRETSPWITGRSPWDATVDSGRLFFTSGATEALNWAIKGTFERAEPHRRRIVTVATEHAAVLDTISSLARYGAEIVVLPVDKAGCIDPHHAQEAIDERTALVAMMYVNNEIGTLQHIGLLRISERARAVGAPVICDAVQAFGKMDVPVSFCDLIAISAHKMHGPKGIGALWVRHGHEPNAILHGGGQEGGLRSGTLSPALCAGFGAAAALARHHDSGQRIFELFQEVRDRFRDDGWRINGARGTRWYGNLSFRKSGINAARLISDVRGVAFSAGSACASGSGRPSHVLKAIGLTDDEARSTIRLGFGRYTTGDELHRAVTMILDAAARQRMWAA